MRIHRLNRNEQLLRYLLRVQPGGKGEKHLLLPVGEPVHDRPAAGLLSPIEEGARAGQDVLRRQMGLSQLTQRRKNNCPRASSARGSGENRRRAAGA